jgi:hypothetical protein
MAYTDTIFKELEKMEKSIGDSKQTLANLKGREQEAMSAMKRDIGVSLLKDAETEFVLAVQELQEKDNAISVQYEEIAAKWQW